MVCTTELDTGKVITMGNNRVYGIGSLALASPGSKARRTLSTMIKKQRWHCTDSSLYPGFDVY